MRLQIITLLAIFAVAIDVATGAKPCRANRPTTPESDQQTTVNTVSEQTSPAPDSKAPCMAVWENLKAEDADFADYALSTKPTATADECGKVCAAEIKCGYSFFKTGKCMSFERFIPTDFVKNGDMSLVFKLYLNGTTTCETATMDGLATSKEKMYYPDGGSYWLFNNIMDTVGYASYNPELGYKRRKRSILNWILNY
uniref:Apple domain-containing protein n=1 Tax=Caenorhabditis tropicalis TaxID=1561998 RepID=A0A1I7UXL1_9PELO